VTIARINFGDLPTGKYYAIYPKIRGLEYHIMVAIGMYAYLEKMAFERQGTGDVDPEVHNFKLLSVLARAITLCDALLYILPESPYKKNVTTQKEHLEAAQAVYTHGEGGGRKDVFNASRRDILAKYASYRTKFAGAEAESKARVEAGKFRMSPGGDSPGAKLATSAYMDAVETSSSQERESLASQEQIGLSELHPDSTDEAICTANAQNVEDDDRLLGLLSGLADAELIEAELKLDGEGEGASVFGGEYSSPRQWTPYHIKDASEVPRVVEADRAGARETRALLEEEAIEREAAWQAAEGPGEEAQAVDPAAAAAAPAAPAAEEAAEVEAATQARAAEDGSALYPRMSKLKF
jgi:hypothetical protein